MLQRNWFFWMEALQITAAERRVILGSMAVLLVITGFRMFYPGRTIYDESYYKPVIAEFQRLSGVMDEERGVLLARYYPPEEPDRQLAGMEPGPAVDGSVLGEPSRPGTRPRRPAASTGDGEELRVNIQLAGIDELIRLPGIGPVTAGRIVAYRDENGPFEKPEDLLNVSGIGPVILSNIREFIIVDTGPEETTTNTPEEEA